MKRLLIALLIAAVGVLTSVIVLLYSTPRYPCTPAFERTSDLLAPASPKVLFDGSELVVVGRITDSAAKCEGSQIWTFMQVTVEESLKNPNDIQVLTAKSYGGTIGGQGMWMEDSPIFNKGDRALLYIYRDDPGDTVYRLSPYSVILVDEKGQPDGTINGIDLLKSFQVKSVTVANGSTVIIPRGSSKEIKQTLESFFGYDSPINVSLSSFVYYNDTPDDANGTLTSDHTDFSDLEAFGISVNPAHFIIIPKVNATTQAEFRFSVSENAVLGTYDIAISAAKDIQDSNLPGKVANTYVRINVIENLKGDSNDNISSPLSPAFLNAI